MCMPLHISDCDDAKIIMNVELEKRPCRKCKKQVGHSFPADFCNIRCQASWCNTVKHRHEVDDTFREERSDYYESQRS